MNRRRRDAGGDERARRVHRLERVAVHDDGRERGRLFARERAEDVTKTLDGDIVRGVHRAAGLVLVRGAHRQRLVRERDAVVEEYDARVAVERAERRLDGRHPDPHPAAILERQLGETRAGVRGRGAADGERAGGDERDVVERRLRVGDEPLRRRQRRLRPADDNHAGVHGRSRGVSHARGEREERVTRVVIFATASTGDEAEVRGDHLGGRGLVVPGRESVQRARLAKQTKRLGHHRLARVREHRVHHALLELRVPVRGVRVEMNHSGEIETRRERLEINLERERGVSDDRPLARRHHRRRLAARPRLHRVVERQHHLVRVLHPLQELRDRVRVRVVRDANLETRKTPRAVTDV